MVLKCDGYEMFRGSFLVTPIGGYNGNKPFRKHGIWLHKPATKTLGIDIWYVQPDNGLSESYPAEILSDREVDD